MTAGRKTGFVVSSIHTVVHTLSFKRTPLKLKMKEKWILKKNNPWFKFQPHFQNLFSNTFPEIGETVLMVRSWSLISGLLQGDLQRWVEPLGGSPRHPGEDDSHFEEYMWVFLKMVGFPQQPWGFPTKNDHLGVWNGGASILGNPHMFQKGLVQPPTRSWWIESVLWLLGLAWFFRRPRILEILDEFDLPFFFFRWLVLRVFGFLFDVKGVFVWSFLLMSVYGAVV